MIRGGGILLALALPGVLGGCVAAAMPALASGAIVREQLNRRAASARVVAAVPAPVAARPVPMPVPVASPPVVPETMRYLYASGEAAALSVQAYQSLAAYIAGPVAYRRKGMQRQVVLAEGSTLDKPFFEACGDKPKAIVLDVDETALLNLGYEGEVARTGAAYDPEQWARWEAGGADRVGAVPGAKAALDAARASGVKVIFNTNRSNADATQRALEGAGLGPAVHRDTLFLKGDDGATGAAASGKDLRRWAIASGFCVVAMVGDQLGDFSDLFNDPALGPVRRRALAASPAVAPLWGDGWFLLPNPVYGPGIVGSYDDAFPADRRWGDTPAQGEK